jgi:hypothetical protein
MSSSNETDKVEPVPQPAGLSRPPLLSALARVDLCGLSDRGHVRPGNEDHFYVARFASGQPQYPLGTVALYGPDDKTTTKIAAGVILHDGAEAIIKRWVATDVTTNPKVQQEMKDFFLQHGVKQVAMSEGNMGCPHEEGEDFPHGEDCPFCPFWKGKQGSNRRE